MPVTALMQQFVEDELDRAPELIDRTLAGTLQLLRDPKNNALYASERAQHFALVEALSTRGAAFRRSFADSLRRRAGEELQAARELSGQAPSMAGSLQLMDETQVEIDIEISRAIQLIDSTAEWELRELQTFTSTLVGLSHVSAESNPLRPHVYVSALWDAAGAIVTLQAQRMVVLRVASGVLAGLLKSAWAAASSRLEALGVEPSAYRTVLLAPGSVPEVPRLRRGPSSAFQVLLADPPGMRPLNLSVTASRTGGIGAVEPSVRPENQATRLVELVSRIFRAIAADERVATEARETLMRFQDPVLRLVLADADALQGFEHPAWALLDRVGRVGQDFAGGDARQRRMLAFAGRLAGELGASEAIDAAQFRSALARLDEFAAEQWQEQLHGAEPAIEQLQRLELRDLLEHRLAERLVEQMAPMKVPPLVRRFVSAQWSRVVARAMVEQGEHHPTTTRYVQAVDDLLWSLAPPPHPKSRQRLATMLPGLLETLRSGMASIAMAESERQAVLDELLPIHAEGLRPRSAAESEMLSAQEIVQRMRDEVIPLEPPRSFGDSVIDVASMDTVPAEFLPSTVDGQAETAEAIAVGHVRRMFVGGRWAHVQLLWRSSQGQYLLFAGEGPGRTHSMTRRALERLQAARLVQPVEVQPLVQRTIDTLMHQLALP